MLDKLLLQIASDLCSFCHLGNFLGEITAGRKGNNLYTAGESIRRKTPESGPKPNLTRLDPTRPDQTWPMPYPTRIDSIWITLKTRPDKTR